MSRRSNSGERRSEIASALLRMIAKHGYEGATIQRIASEAGLAPGLVHYHFGSKRDVLVHLVQMLADVARVRFKAVLSAEVGPDARLVAYLRARLGLGEGAAPDVVAAWVMIGAESVRQVEVREIYAGVVREELDLLTQLFGDCLLARSADPSSARDWAAGVLSLIEGAFQLSSAAAGVLPRGFAAEAAITFAIGAISGGTQRST